MTDNNLCMLTDLYQLTMTYGYWKQNKCTDQATFDLFYRRHPESNYVVVAGIEQAIDYIKNFGFTANDIEYLNSLNIFEQDFLSYLYKIKFTGEVYAMDEGTIAFPNEPIMRISGNIIECQLVETTLLNIINHQSLIATKAARVVRAAEDCKVSDFGLRRAQGPDSGLFGSRAAYIGGCTSTSNVLAGQKFGIPVSGTHAHSWIMSFSTELEAFRAYANTFPDSCLLLIDTYNVLESGLPNAITVFRELRDNGHEPIGVRIDSGDLAYLSKQVRTILDYAGFPNVVIVASNDLDEYIIADLKIQGAKINVFGVGTKMITSYNTPALGGVYKLSELNGEPRMKLSENIEKTTNPGKKMVYRLVDQDSNMAIADLITLDNEVIKTDKPLTIYHSTETWKKRELKNFTVQPLLHLYYFSGSVVKAPLTLQEARQNLSDNFTIFWDEYLRLTNPQFYKVDISDNLYDLKKELIENLA